MKLPIEIRERIIRITVASMYSTSQIEPSVHIAVFRDRDHDLTLCKFGFQGSFIDYQGRMSEQVMAVTKPPSFCWIELHFNGMVAKERYDGIAIHQRSAIGTTTA